MLQCMCRHQALNWRCPEVFEIASYVFRRQKPTRRVLWCFLTVSFPSLTLLVAEFCNFKTCTASPLFNVMLRDHSDSPARTMRRSEPTELPRQRIRKTAIRVPEFLLRNCRHRFYRSVNLLRIIRTRRLPHLLRPHGRHPYETNIVHRRSHGDRFSACCRQ